MEMGKEIHYLPSAAGYSPVVTRGVHRHARELLYQDPPIDLLVVTETVTKKLVEEHGLPHDRLHSYVRSVVLKLADKAVYESRRKSPEKSLVRLGDRLISRHEVSEEAEALAAKWRANQSKSLWPSGTEPD